MRERKEEEQEVEWREFFSPAIPFVLERIYLILAQKLLCHCAACCSQARV
jgi:hypothetical protein